MRLSVASIAAFWFLFLGRNLVQGCSVCVGVAALPLPRASPVTWAVVATTRLAEHKPLLVGTALVAHHWVRQEQRKRRYRRSGRTVRYAFLSEQAGDDETLSSGNEDNSTKQEEKETTAQPMTTAMIASIGFYKRFISPLLPPACRFLPTCSQYGVQAIEQFGPTKGAILTAWRLLRCSPLGGKGYDPPRWPPVGYQYSSY